MTNKHRLILAELEREAQRESLAHHLEAARALAHDGLDVDTIEGMLRFMFSRTQIGALLAEARAARAAAPLPVIE